MDPSQPLPIHQSHELINFIWFGSFVMKSILHDTDEFLPLLFVLFICFVQVLEHLQCVSPKDEKIRNTEKRFQELLGSITGFPRRKYKQMMRIILK